MTDRTRLESPLIQHNPLLVDEGLALYKGWDGELAEQLSRRSRESAIRESSPHDAKLWFPSAPKAERWYARKPRVIYSLFHTAELAGAAWFEKDRFASFEQRFSFRMYERARGKHFTEISEAFARAAHMDYALTEGYSGDTWVETDFNNQGERELFTRLNYQILNTPDVPVRKIRMGRAGIGTRMAEVLESTD
jgi:hypothetical protein